MGLDYWTGTLSTEIHLPRTPEGVSNRWTGFSTGTWDWNVGLDYLTGTWDSSRVSLIAVLDSPLEHGTGMWDWNIVYRNTPAMHARAR